MESIRQVLKEGGADIHDIIKQNIYYAVNEQSPAPRDILNQIRDVQNEYFGSPMPVTTETAVVGLGRKGLYVVIEAIATTSPDRQNLTPANHWDRNDGAAHVQGCRVGEWIFVAAQRSLDQDGELRNAGGIAAQTRNVYEGMLNVLGAAGASLKDLLRMNTYYQYEGSGHAVTDFWEQMTNVRMEFLPNPGPSGTAVRVHGFPIEGELIQVEGIAHLGTNRTRLIPKDHWDWSMPVPFSQGWRVGNTVFCGGQISADAKGRTIATHDIERQTANTFEFLNRLLEEAGATMSDVVKLNTYYQYDGVPDVAAEYWQKMMAVQLRYFPPQGPSMTVVCIDGYAFEELLIEVDAIAVIDR
jgi:enamine deaminase RidA (YjgF/YER057c/UK114 family)